MIISQDSEIKNIVSASINVVNSSVLTIYGMVNGNIYLESKSKVVIYGMVNGTITNDGLCEIYGVVNGKLIKKEGEFVIDKKAIIVDSFFG